jgi:fatty-acyl-CoA synthase
MANALLGVADATRYDVSSLRQIMIGGAASSPELIERMRPDSGMQCVCRLRADETCPVLTTAQAKSDVVPVWKGLGTSGRQ